MRTQDSNIHRLSHRLRKIILIVLRLKFFIFYIFYLFFSVSSDILEIQNNAITGLKIQIILPPQFSTYVRCEKCVELIIILHKI